MKTKKQTILIRVALVVLAFLILARIVAPPLILSRTNEYLAKFSPIMSGHIGDLDIAIWRMAYGFNDITLKEKKSDRVFLAVKDVDVSLSWSELFRGRILTDIEVSSARMDLDRSLTNLAAQNKESAKTSAQDAKNSLFPVSVGRLSLNDSTVKFRPPKTEGKDLAWELKDIEATVSNLTPKTAEQKTFFVGSGALQGDARIKIAGEAFLKADPIEWSVDAQMKNFNLREANPILLNVAPLTFQKGSLDLYSEVRSKAGSMLGYVKPIAENVEVVGDKADFKEGPRQFLVEIVTQIAQFIVRDPGTDTVATQIDFGTVDGEFKVNTGKAISEAFKHGFGKNVKPGLENRLGMPEKKGK